MNHRASAVLVMLLLITGCATQGINTSASDSELKQITHEIVVSMPQPQLWDVLVNELSKSSYVIHNIDKESRIINVSFSTFSPAEYVDCGKANRSYTEGVTIERYDYARPETVKAATVRQEKPAPAHYVDVQKVSMLDGFSNIYVAPDEKDNTKTIITVNSLYILNTIIKHEIFAQDANGNILSRDLLSDQIVTHTFNTSTPERQVLDGMPMTCLSQGKIEKDIFDMIRGKQSMLHVDRTSTIHSSL